MNHIEADLFRSRYGDQSAHNNSFKTQGLFIGNCVYRRAQQLSMKLKKKQQQNYKQGTQMEKCVRSVECRIKMQPIRCAEQINHEIIQ